MDAAQAFLRKARFREGLPKALWELRRLQAFALRAGWRENRCHQVVVPFTRDLEMGRSAEFKGLDQIMVYIGKAAPAAPPGMNQVS